MGLIIPTSFGLAMFAAASPQAAPAPTKVYPHKKWHEIPAQNVWRSQRYDHLVSTNAVFSSSRMRKECGPITDAALRSDCIASFGAYEPTR